MTSVLQMFRTLPFIAGAVILAGCAGSNRPTRPRLTTVALPDPMVVSRPAPLPGPSSAPAREQAVIQSNSPSPRLLTGQPWPAEWVNVWVPLSSWTRVNGLPAPLQLASETPAQFTVRTPQGSIRIRTGSQTVYLHGHDFALGYAARVVGGVPYVHSLDLEKTFQPLLSSAGFSGAPRRTLVIDPGHGGKDSGTGGRFAPDQEKHYALDWALRLERILVAEGWKVFLTRTNDIDVALADRVSFAERVGADLYISLHFNSGARNSDMSGIETYCLTPTGLPSTLRRDYEDDPREKHPNNAFDEANVVFASRIHKSLLDVTGAPDRGVRRARFMTVLRGQNRPAILVEGGYLSNPDEALRIASPAYRQTLAQGVAAGLIAGALSDSAEVQKTTDVSSVPLRPSSISASP